MAYSQNERPIRIDTPLGPDRLLLEEFSGTEYISRPFEFSLRATSTDASLSLAELLNKPVAISLETISSARYFHGIVRRASQVAMIEGRTAYELEIVPRIWLLSLSWDCRIFQNESADEIVRKILTEQNYTDFSVRLTGKYERREYCVQYRESTLNFISRLMEEEGIFYFFEHTSAGHTLVIADTIAAFKDCPENPSVRYNASATAARENDVVNELSYLHAIQSRTISLADYDFQKPAVKLDVRATSAEFDVYDYPGLYLTRDQGERLARIRLEEREAARIFVGGSSNCRHFVPGHRFHLKEHYNDDVNGTYTLLSVSHAASGISYRSGQSGGFQYSNVFQAMPSDTPFRPPRTAEKPIVQGSQTAIVVGKQGEEIWVDTHGRVKLQFHWDRLGTNDQKSSCWVRVSQSWAGRQWGSVQIPRVGQEVIVDFLEGNPDRPLVIGRVYNAVQMPPYSLPSDQTVSGVKSRSTKNGTSENYNEIVFEDQKGEEFIRFHAEKDLQQYVEQNSYEYIGKDRHLIVDGSQAELAKGDLHITVEGEKRESVKGDVSLSVGNNDNHQIGQVYSVKSGQEIHIQAGMKVIIQAGMQISLIGPGGFVDIGPAGVTIQGNMVLINSGGSAGSGTACEPEAPKAPEKAS